MAKLSALTKALRFARAGERIKDRGILFCVGLLNQLDHSRTRSRRLISRMLALLVGKAEFCFSVILNGTTHCITARLGDLADYQSIWECLGEMYAMPPGKVRHVFDGGGNLGLFSLVATSRLGIQDIMIIEPDPSNFALLDRNLARVPECRKARAALAGHDGVARFDRTSSNGGHLSSEGFEVTTRRISSLIPEQWQAEHTWLKLDIEGAEYDVIPDMLATGLRPAFISGEIHDYLGCGGEALVQQLRDAGYSVTIDGLGFPLRENICRHIRASLTEPWH